MQRGREQTAAVMNMSLDLFDELIESHAPSAGRLSAANDGLAAVKGTNAPAAHLAGKKKESAVSTAAVFASGGRRPSASVMCSICLI